MGAAAAALLRRGPRRPGGVEGGPRRGRGQPPRPLRHEEEAAEGGGRREAEGAGGHVEALRAAGRPPLRHGGHTQAGVARRHRQHSEEFRAYRCVEGPIKCWLFGYYVLKDGKSRDELISTFFKMKGFRNVDVDTFVLAKSKQLLMVGISCSRNIILIGDTHNRMY